MGGIVGHKCKTKYCRNQVYYGTKEFCDECWNLQLDYEEE